jgi:ABC-2 type transport system permease protein
MPLLFASNAIYPASIMPSWLQYLIKVNPFSYTVDALRGLLLPAYQANLGVDFLAIIITVIVLAGLAGWSFRRMLS